VSGDEPNGSAFVPSTNLAFNDVDALLVWAGANAAAEPMSAAKQVVFMAFCNRLWVNGVCCWIEFKLNWAGDRLGTILH
jgi:hypothetical protein